MLKLDVAFLYDLLGASQEHMIKPKKFAQTYIDEVILGHTNEPEYKKLQGNEMMEAFRDRTIKIDVPYNIRLDDEVRIYNKDFGTERIKGMHVAPHTVEVAAMWAVLTRLAEPKKAGITKLQKLKLYNGKSIPGFTEDSIKELKEEAPREGMQGISPRYIQDKISNALVSHQAQTEKAINPFMVMNELEEGLSHHSLITDEELKKDYKELLATVREEYEDILKGEVQRAISADEDAIKRLATNYIESRSGPTPSTSECATATPAGTKIPDERLMRSIEEKIDIPDSRKDDFRQEIMNYIGALALDGKRFEYNTNARLLKALELKLFEDQRDTIKLKNLVSSVVDDETQQKIDVVKQRLIKYFGYNETSATDVLNYVASIFARGDSEAGGLKKVSHRWTQMNTDKIRLMGPLHLCAICVHLWLTALLLGASMTPRRPGSLKLLLSGLAGTWRSSEADRPAVRLGQAARESPPATTRSTPPTTCWYGTAVGVGRVGRRAADRAMELMTRRAA